MLLDRPLLALATLALAALAALPASAATPLETQIAEALKGFRGTMGVAAKNLTTGETVSVDADTVFPTASAIKTAVMVEVFHQVAEGRLRHDTPVVLKAADKVDGSGVTQRLHDGLTLTVDDLLDLMITVSDNTATNLLIGLVGTARIDERMAGYGLPHTKVYRPTFRDGRPDVFPEEEKQFGFGATTPREMARLMELIAEGRVVDRAASDAMMRVLSEQAFRIMIPRLLPETEDVVVANKPGWDSEKRPDARGVKRHIRADEAIVTTPRGRYVVAIFARGIEDTRWGPDNEGTVMIARISRMIFDRW